MKQVLKFVPILTCTALALGLAAQEAATATKTDALVIKTSNAELANNMLRSGGEEAPDLKDGQHYVLTLQQGGEWKVATADGKAPYMQVAAKPKQLMEMFAEQVDSAKQMTGMMAGMMAAQGGIDADAMQQFMDDLIEFPNQLETMTMTVEEEKGNYQARGEISGFKASAFGKLMGVMKATGKGAPDFGGNAAMTLSLDLAPAAFLEMYRPFVGLMPGLDTKDAKAKATKTMEEMMAAADGTMAMVVAEAGMRMLMGSTDGKKYAAMLEGQDYQKLMQTMMNNAEGKMTPKAVTHRDVSLFKVEAELDADQPNPLATDGKLVSFGGVVGDFVMMVMKGGEPVAKQTIDAVLDQKVKRKVLNPGTFANASIKVAELVTMLSNGEADVEDAPKQIDVQLGATGAALTFQVAIKK